MKRTLWTALLTALLAQGAPPTAADEKFSTSRAEIQKDLVLEVAATRATRVRPGKAVHVSARLVNRSPTRTHRVIRPGSGCAVGIVEPFVFYTARYTPHDGEPRDIEQRPFQGMCGMGDYRWHRLVTDLGPGDDIDVAARLSWASASLDMKRPGRYALRVHYAFRRRGTRDRLPQADPVGDLGPMKALPSFEIASEPVTFDVVRPLEVFVEPIGKLKPGVAQQLQRLVRVRFENWRSKKSVTLDNTRLKIFVQIRSSPKSPRIRRETMAMPAAVVTKTLAPGQGVELIGPAGGWFDEVWEPDAAGSVDVRVLVTGHESGAPRVVSHWATIPGP